jgi:hypothetical protein
MSKSSEPSHVTLSLTFEEAAAVYRYLRWSLELQSLRHCSDYHCKPTIQDVRSLPFKNMVKKMRKIPVLSTCIYPPCEWMNPTVKENRESAQGVVNKLLQLFVSEPAYHSILKEEEKRMDAHIEQLGGAA